MKIYNLFEKYYNIESSNIKKFYNLIIDLIDFFKLDKLVNSIEICDNANGYFSYFDLNNKKLLFSNNLFSNNIYRINSSKAIVYILHEIIHIMQAKIICSPKFINIPEIEILKNSYFINSFNYNSIMPLHEYQAFLNSNYLLLKYLILSKMNTDIDICRDIITNLLYNNYYDLNGIFLSPIEQTAKYLKFSEYNDSLIPILNEDDLIQVMLFGKKVHINNFIIGNKILRKEIL